MAYLLVNLFRTPLVAARAAFNRSAVDPPGVENNAGIEGYLLAVDFPR